MWLSLSLLSLLLVGMRVEGAGPVNSAALNLYKHAFNGDATYYGDSGGGGTCSYGVQNPPVASLAKIPVALNKPQFLNSLMCGSCWQVTGSGHGLGNNPVTGTFMVFVDDLCPGCQAGDVDLGVSGDGRWDISIKAVQCPVGNGKLDYKFQGSNPWYIKLQVQNARLPVHMMEIDLNGWQKMQHSADGFFLHSGGPIHGSFRVRVTAINGAQVIDTISGIHNDVIIHGKGQFPLDSSLPH
ncbi:expansin-YoaJ-like [Littorina saxatilis]|uniref:Expansin-like EG45 domain-containing protein n=1 Tax=Littorina saxatilis TaxID=31220 RepID=A0AAN9GRX0_9CAEN